MNARIDHWPETIQAHIASECSIFHTVHVFPEVASTQDAARGIGAKPGEAIVAGRQTSGRGRLGRKWADTGQHGVAVTMVIPRAAPETLAIASAVGAALALERHQSGKLGLKWPNDVMARGKKLAGILIEQAHEAAFIGVGMNVSQTTFPLEINDRAISLAQLGIEVDRLAVICSLLTSVDQALRMTESELQRHFMERDVLSGSHATLSCRGQVHSGRIGRIDPFGGLELLLDAGEVIWLPAMHTSLVSADLASV